jgi:hypothetical protein
VNGIWYTVQESTYRLLMTTHDRIQPVSGAHENLGHVALPAEPSAQVVDRPPACLPACLPLLYTFLSRACLPACLLLRRSSGPPPGSLLSLSPPARACISELSLLSFSHSFVFFSSSLGHEEFLLLLPPIPISRCCSPLHVCFFFFLAFQLSF